MRKIFNNMLTTVLQIKFFANISYEESYSSCAVGGYFLFIAFTVEHHVV